MSGDGTWATPGQDDEGEPGGRPSWPVGDQAPPPPPPPPGSTVPPPPPPPGAPPPPPRQPAGGPGQRVGLVPLYPLGIGDVLDTSFRMLRACAVPSALVVVLVLGPVQVLSSVAFVSPLEVLREPVPQEVDPTLFVVSMIGSLLTVVAMPLVAAALTWLGSHATEQQVPGWQAALRQGARRYWATLGAYLLLLLAVAVVVFAVALVTVLASLASPVLGVLLGVPLGLGALFGSLLAYILGYLAVPCIVVEGLGPLDGLRRAARLFRARFGATLGVSLVVGLVFTVIGQVIGTALSIPGFIPFPGSWVFVALGGIGASLVTAPLGAYAALAIHVDQRIRTEGYDVAVLVSELRR